MSETESLSDLVAFVARALVDKPDEVLVEEVPTPRGVVLELSVAEDDIGKVIGKDGRTAQAIRTVLSAASAKSGETEPTKGRPRGGGATSGARKSRA